MIVVLFIMDVGFKTDKSGKFISDRENQTNVCTNVCYLIF